MREDRHIAIIALSFAGVIFVFGFMFAVVVLLVTGHLK